MDIGRAFNDAVEVYKKNWLILFLAACLLEILGLLTLLILFGPLYGGVCRMLLGAMQREDKSVNMGDMFGCFDRFGRLLGLFFLTFIATLIGLVLCVLPGLALSTIWLFVFYLAVDKDLGVFRALGVSQNIVSRKGLGKNFLLVIIVLALEIGASIIPYAGIILGWLISPIAWLLVTSAYIQQVHEDTGALQDLFDSPDEPPAAEPATP